MKRSSVRSELLHTRSGTLKSLCPHTALTAVCGPRIRRPSRLASTGFLLAILEAGTSIEDYARRLYSELRRLDELGVDLLIAETVNEKAWGWPLTIDCGELTLD